MTAVITGNLFYTMSQWWEIAVSVCLCVFVYLMCVRACV